MRAKDRITAREKLDKRLNSFRNSDALARPPRGWVKAIREALGMSTRQLGRRMGVSQARVSEIEKHEATGALTLDSLEKAARALQCKLVYVLVPLEPLEQMAEQRALEKARRQLGFTGHSMRLEAQGVEGAATEEQVRRLAAELREQPGSRLWDEP
ncbi:MAG: mobile mystery protein A [Verrucomicrobiales bacterium]|nr:mobile mystery protein A [Verrucomicrobiales bacterium]